ncbi:MAG: substrate-binding domain-containing protein [Actinobacteria bacterium]|nr:substrate-binding domain-containing protein [Actinomycetota bacterium]
MFNNQLRWGLGLIGAIALTFTAAGCAGTPAGTGAPAESPAQTQPAGDLTTIGFVAVGPEGAWRKANEQNVQDTFTKEAGFDLKYAPAANLDQKSQIDAFTAFVDEGVDLILLSATEATGWEDSLQRAQEAEIPVILVDRGISPDDTSLYATRLAPNNVTVAKSIAEWLVANYPDGGEYITLEGPAGVGVVDERNQGFDEVISGAPQWKKVGAQTANWKVDEGKSVTETFLKSNPNIKFVFAQNDEMGLGASEAVTEAGKVVGADGVLIATIDGTKNAIQALADGKLSFVAEYNPLFGDQLLDAVKKALAGEKQEPYIEVISTTFDSPEAAKAALPDRKF